MSRLLLWDIDGTLIRGKGAGTRAMNAAFRRLHGVENAFDQIEMAGGLDLHFIHAAYEQSGVAMPPLEAYLNAYYEALELEVAGDNTFVLPGVRELLDWAAAEPGVYNALGTGNVERGAYIKLAVHGLASYFPAGGFCTARTERFEVLADGVRRASAHYGVSFAPEQVLVIGDTKKDILAARQIGAQVLAVATGGGTYEELHSYEPDALLEDLSDVAAVKRLLGGR